MKYPEKYTPDGRSTEIAQGDLVWWNEGTGIGYVHQIIEEGHDLISYECFDEPHVSFVGLHPYEPATEWNGGVFYPQSVLEDEGVGLLSLHEQAELSWALEQAHEFTGGGYQNWSYFVSAIQDMERGEEDWVIQFSNTEDERSEEIKIPFRPNTRTTIG